MHYELCIMNYELGVRMGRKSLYILISLAALVFFSCEEPLKVPSTPNGNFFSKDFRDNSSYRITAGLLAKGEYCEVWAERKSGVNVTTAKNMADTYDKKIYPRMMEVFGFPAEVNGESLNPVEYANWISNGRGDNKLTILLLDIKDNYKEKVNEAYIAGYFWSGNLYNGSDSNRRAIIFIDTNPGKAGDEEAYATLAHEMQHLMNFVSSLVHQRKGIVDTWIDEGLSAAAEWVYLEKHVERRIKWFNNEYNDTKGLIDKGNNFYVWNNHLDNQYAVLDDYATVYLFFQWLRLQAEKPDIYYDIITSQEYNYQAVTNAIDKKVPNQGYSDWGTLLKTWLAANYINAPDSPYGYSNDRVLLERIKTGYMPFGVTSIDLYPGEGVYSRANYGITLPAQGPNIENAYLSKNPARVESSWSRSGALLTFNANTNRYGASETGAVTGQSPPRADIQSPDFNSRSIQGSASEFTGPYPVGAGDLGGRNGQGASFFSRSIGEPLPSGFGSGSETSVRRFVFNEGK